MKKVLLPTPDYAPAKGGVARFLGAMKETLGPELIIEHLQPLPRGVALYKTILHAYRASSCQQIWTSHIFPVGSIALALRITKRIPYSVILHGMDFDLAKRNWLRRSLARLILRHADHLIVNSEALKREVDAFTRKSSMVVYPVPSDDYYRDLPPAREKTGKRLLSVSRLVKRKGHAKVIALLPSLKEVEYWIVGEGKEREELEDLAKNLHVSDRIRFLGAVSDEELKRIYESCDIFVLPTTKTALDREGFGIVYLEAQLSGLPVIAVSHPGVDEAVLGGGLLIEDTKVALKDAIEKLLADGDLRLHLAKRGRDRILREFTREKQFGKLSPLVK